jgi:hypothetical protein
MTWRDQRLVVSHLRRVCCRSAGRCRCALARRWPATRRVAAYGSLPVTSLAGSAVRARIYRFCAASHRLIVPCPAASSREDLRVLRRCGSASRRAVRALGGGMPRSIVARARRRPGVVRVPAPGLLRCAGRPRVADRGTAAQPGRRPGRRTRSGARPFAGRVVKPLTGLSGSRSGARRPGCSRSRLTGRTRFWPGWPSRTIRWSRYPKACCGCWSRRWGRARASTHHGGGTRDCPQPRAMMRSRSRMARRASRPGGAGRRGPGEHRT